MLNPRRLACVVAAVFSLAASSFVFADHLDRFETHRIVLHLEERVDAFQDRIDDWVMERREERTDRAADLNRRMGGLSEALDQLKEQLRHHDEPWETRDQARAVIDSVADVGQVIEGDTGFSRQFRESWDGLRETTNELARHYHLGEVVVQKRQY